MLKAVNLAYTVLWQQVLFFSDVELRYKNIKKKKKVGGTVGSTDSLQILFVWKEVEVQRRRMAIF